MSKRGRPATGKALTAAEKQREYRRRQAEGGAVDFTAPKARKPRSDSVAAQVAAMVEVDADAILPPEECAMSAGAMPFWHRVIVSRPAGSWSETDLMAAANLAQCEYEIATERRSLAAEQSIIVNQHGASIVNPRFVIVDKLNQRAMALRRTLGFVGRAATMANANILHQESKNKAAAADDGLLA